jgi:hypothetical protein
MAQDFTALSTTELYAALLTHINDRDAALALGLDPATTTVTNPLTNSVRWNSANRYWEKFGGVSWAPLASPYAINITGTAPWAGITGKPATVTGYGITDGITTANIGAQHVTNSDQLGGQVPSYYQAALGFTPVQQGGGTGQGTNKVYVGWNAAGLYLQVDATNYAAVWPIGISGNAATATTAGTVTTAAQPNITSVGTLTSLAVSGVATLGAGSILGGMSAITNSLAANVNLNNIANYFDGPSVAQGTVGTWFVSGTITVFDNSAGGGRFIVKLWDGTTVIEATEFDTAQNKIGTASLSGIAVNPAGNLRISVKDASSTSATLLANETGTGKDSTITAIRIG